MSTEIKNTLFRFVTMRAPELADASKKELRFVFRKFNTNSSLVMPFDVAVNSTTLASQKWQAMRAVSFNPLKEEEIKALNAELHNFGVWIARNKHSFTMADFELERNKVQEAIVEDVKLNLIWNNLFYQVLHQNNFYAKEALMQLLIANHVFKNSNIINQIHTNILTRKSINEISEIDFEDIKAIVNAKVVLPKELFLDDNSQNGIGFALRNENTSKSIIGTYPTDAMSRVQKRTTAKNELKRINELQKALKKVKSKHNFLYKKNYEVALLNHQKEVENILLAYEQLKEDKKNDWCDLRNPQTPYDPKNICDQPPLVPHPKLPVFVFPPADKVSWNFLQSELPGEIFEYLLEILEINSDELSSMLLRNGEEENDDSGYSQDIGFADIDGNIFTVVTTLNNTIVANTPQPGNPVVTSNGVLLNMHNEIGQPLDFQLCPEYVNGNITFYLAITVPNEAYIPYENGCNYTLEGENNTNSVLVLVERDGNTLFFKTQTSHPESLSATSTEFNAVILFTNGEKINISIPTSRENSIFKSCASGTGTLIGNEDEDENNQNTNVLAGFIPSGFGMRQLGIADYKKVEQSVQGYVEGEVAHIENVMAREYKEKATRKLVKSETTTTTSSESEKEKLSDTTSTSRFEMQSEVASVLQEARDMQASSNFNSSWGGSGNFPKFNLGVSAGLATHSSREDSNRNAQTEAQEITQRAMERVVTKVKQERIEKIIEEFEENNKHGFDNTKGDKHVVGVYRWVDKIYKNRILNYGKRLMFEFMIPEPSRLHRLGMDADREVSKLVQPVDPRTHAFYPISTFTDINENNAKYWGGALNVELPIKPEEQIILTHSFKDTSIGTDNDGGMGRWNGAFSNNDFKIPENYAVSQVSGNINIGGMHGSASVGTLYICGRETTSVVNETFAEKIREKITLSGNFWDIKVISGTLNAVCELTPEALKKWKQETFKIIMDAYEEAIAVYESRLADEKAKEKAIREANPGFYRQIENLILRKNCISYMLSQDTGSNHTYGRNMAKPLPSGTVVNFGNYEVNVSAELDQYTALVRFMEQAFEWNIMSYNFYPYYWGNRTKWSELYQTENNDPLFRSFMNAGMARVVVTVRPGFEDAVRYYMQTGQIWNGGEVPVIDEPLYLSIVDELREPAGKPEGKAWWTRIPTALTILQAQTIGLIVTQALPYNENVSDFEDPTSVPQSEGLDFSPAQLGVGSGTARVVGKIFGNENKEVKITLQKLETVKNLTYCDASGYWELNNVPAGDYTLLLDTNNDLPTESYTVTEGSKTLQITLVQDQVLEVNLTVQPVSTN